MLVLAKQIKTVSRPRRRHGARWRWLAVIEVQILMFMHLVTFGGGLQTNASPPGVQESASWSNVLSEARAAERAGRPAWRSMPLHFRW